jgi:hypothetical protein
MTRQANTPPPGLVVGIWLSVATVVISSLGDLVTDGNPLQWLGVSVAGTIAGAWLAATGALELSRRLVGGRARAAQVSAAGFAVMAAVSIADMVIAFGASNIEQIERWYAVFPYVFLAGFLLAGIGLAIAGPARSAVVLATAIGALSFFEARIPVVQKLFDDLLTGWRAPVFTAIAALLWGGLAYVLVRRAAADSAEAPTQHAGAIAGLRRASAGLWIRLAATSLLAATAGFKVASIERFVMIASPIAGAIAMVIFATALVRVASSSGTELPRRALHVAAFFALWTAVEECMQAFFVYNAVTGFGQGPSFLGTPAWPQATLITSAISIAILLWAIQRLATAAGDETLARNTSTASKVFIIFMAIRTLIVLAVGMNERSLAVLIANPLAIGALVIAAALCGKAATTIEKRPGLATATLRAPD